jgi:hypothetical protein
VISVIVPEDLAEQEAVNTVCDLKPNSKMQPQNDHLEDVINYPRFGID